MVNLTNKHKKMETSLTNIYVPPTVVVRPVALESPILQQSPINNIDVNPWQPETGPEIVTPDTGDIYLPV